MFREAIECCPFCDSENVFVNHHGYKAVCNECGEEMMLCDECRHADDNPTMICDWHEIKINNISYGVCFRGITKHKEA